MAFTLRQLQFFIIAAAEQDLVSGADRALSISQSSITQAVRALEDDLGVTLFDRQARRIDITHKGAAFLRHAGQILADVTTTRTTFQNDAETATVVTGKNRFTLFGLRSGNFFFAKILPPEASLS